MLRAALLAVRQGRQGQGLKAAYRSLGEGQSPQNALAVSSGFSADTVCSSHLHQRTFAAAAEQRVQLPAQVTGLAGQYAAALYIAGYKAKALDQIDNDLVEVWNTAARSKEFRDFLKDPSIPKRAKAEGIEAVLTELKISDLTKRFFGVLAENNRLPDIVRITNTFDDLMAAARGEVTATITTASTLARKELDEIKSGLTQILEKGQKLIVQEQIDPSIIGGIIIDVGDKHIDLSINSRVKKVQQLILETV